MVLLYIFYHKMDNFGTCSILLMNNQPQLEKNDFSPYFRYGCVPEISVPLGRERAITTLVPPEDVKLVSLGTCQSASISSVRQKSYSKKTEGGGGCEC